MARSIGVEALRDALSVQGVTQERAEARLAVGSGYLSHVFAGRYLPGRAIAARIQAEFGVDVSLWDAPKPIRTVRSNRARRKVRAGSARKT